MLSGNGVHVLDDVAGGQVQGQIDLTGSSHIAYNVRHRVFTYMYKHILK